MLNALLIVTICVGVVAALVNLYAWWMHPKPLAVDLSYPVVARAQSIVDAWNESCSEEDDDEDHTLYLVIAGHGDKRPVAWYHTEADATEARKFLEDELRECCLRMDVWHTANPGPSPELDELTRKRYWNARYAARREACAGTSIAPDQVENRDFVSWAVIECPSEPQIAVPSSMEATATEPTRAHFDSTEVLS